MKTERLTVKAFYDRVWREYADRDAHPITAASLAEQRKVVAAWMRSVGPARVLDLGCGPVPVTRAGDAPVVVHADLVLDMLARAPGVRGVPAVCLDAASLPFRARAFDLVWAGLLTDHIRDLHAWFQELRRVLVPAGALGLACWRRDALPRERYPHDRRMRYTRISGEELEVESHPNWHEALRILAREDPGWELVPLPIVPGAYVLEVARGRIGRR